MQLNSKTIIFNAAAGLVLLVGFIYVLRSLFVSEVIPPCSTRYPGVTEFSLDNGNGPMSPEQLVGTIGGSQRGVYRNARVVRVRGIESENALKVSMHPDDPVADQSGEGNGIGFLWSPTSMNDATSVCLAYSVYLPKDFDFANGGVLPGLYAGTPTRLGETADGKASASQRLVWRSEGMVNVYTQLPGDETNGGTYLNGRGKPLEKGRWIRLEQEAVLNTPGKSNGLSRVWVDGELLLDKRRLEWRKEDALKLKGVLADVAYGNHRGPALPPKQTAIYVSPLQLRWN